jgi:hypothetical protein
MDETDEATPVVSNDETDLNQLLGLFDAPAFARRGLDLEYALEGLHGRLIRERSGMLDMVRVRLRQWASVATGPDDWAGVFTAPVAPGLYTASGAEPPAWATAPAPPRRRRAVARDLVASLARFNRRWLHFLDAMKLDSVNRQVEQYNRYYVLEKECVIGSARLAARLFVPKPLLTRESLLADHPLLPVPGLVD